MRDDFGRGEWTTERCRKGGRIMRMLMNRLRMLLLALAMPSILA